jgi:WD40 repeat protein
MGPAGGAYVFVLRDEEAPGSVLVSDIHRRGEPVRIHAHDGVIVGFDFSPDGQYLVTFGDDNQIKFFDTNVLSDEPVSIMELDPDETIYFGAFSTDGNTYLILNQHELIFWDVKNGSEKNRVISEAPGFFHINDDLTLLGTIVNEYEKELLLWHTKDGSAAGVIDLPDGDYTPNHRLSPDGSLLALNMGNVIGIFDVLENTELFTMGEGEGDITKHEFSPDQCTLVVGKSNGDIQLWDLHSRQLMKVLKGHTDSFSYLDFSYDGHLLYSKSLDGTGRVWGVPGAESSPVGSPPENRCGIPPYLPPTPTPTITTTPTVTPTATPPVYQRTLYLQSPSMTGEDVVEVQKRLIELGYLEIGSADGFFGAMTEEAVMHFQEANGLEADGVVGPMTWGVLFSEDAIGVNP